MNMTTELPVVFGEWMRWDLPRDRSSSPSNGGVYLLAHCCTGIPPTKATADCLPFEVIYVGNTKNLNARPASQHRGVKQHHDTFVRKDRLFVAFAPLYKTDCADYAAQRIYSEYVEAMLIWTYTKEHEHPPVQHYGHKNKFPMEVAAVVRALKRVKRRRPE